jgi:hypothetical protein
MRVAKKELRFYISPVRSFVASLLKAFFIPEIVHCCCFTCITNIVFYSVFRRMGLWYY